MSLLLTLNGSSTLDAFLIAPHNNQVFPSILGLATDDGTTVDDEIQVSAQGAGIVLSQTNITVGSGGSTVSVHAISPSLVRNDTTLNILVGGVLEGSISLTAISNPRVWFDGRFEVRFATGQGFYNDPRGNPDGTGRGWMWALEGEPDFVPADSVPDRIEKPVGRVIRFHNPVAPRSHVPPIGVFVKAVEGEVGGTKERFTGGDPMVGAAVNLGPNTYFASNQPVNPADRTAGRLPEERHGDGEQPLALFECRLGDQFIGGSKIGAFVPGTTESQSPRNPDFRPYAQGLTVMSPGERAAFPFLSLRDFSSQRVNQLLSDFVALKAAGQTNSVEFRNLRLRIGHLLPLLEQSLQNQIIADHGPDGVTRLVPSQSFGWGQREVYRGMINESINIQPNDSSILSYFSQFPSFHFLCVFFNFHTDEACGHCYGAVDPSQQPPTL